MNWQKKTISPTKPAYKRQLRFLSPPLMRFFGSIGFIASGLGTLYLMQYILGVDPDIWQSSNWDIKTILLLVASLIVAVFGGLIGAGLGINIEVKSERINHSFSVLWHYLANGMIIWIMLLGLSLTKIYGKEGLKLFVDEVGTWTFTIYTFGISACGNLLIGGLLLIMGVLKEHLKPKMLPCLILSLPIALAMGYLQFTLFAIDSRFWIFMGIALSVALHPVSVYLINRDKEQRRQILER